METIIEQMPEAEASVEDAVKAVIAEKLGLDKDQFGSGTDFSSDFGTDSLDMMEIFMELERKFNMTIQDGEAKKLRTLGSIVNFVKKSKN